jgi:hypothetical protein
VMDGDHVKMDHKIPSDDVDRINLAQDRVGWRAVVNTVVFLFHRTGNFVTN